MRYAIVSDGVVTNIIEADAAFAAAAGGIASSTASVGDTYSGGAFSRPAVAPPVPHQVTKRQARQALLLAGLLDSVQPAIDALPDITQRGLVQIEWDDSQVFERHRPALVSLATALGLSSTQLDDLFRTAASLP